VRRNGNVVVIDLWAVFPLIQHPHRHLRTAVHQSARIATPFQTISRRFFKLASKVHVFFNIFKASTDKNRCYLDVQNVGLYFPLSH